MKVLHLINTLSAGGAELHLLTLCRYLRDQGNDVAVACLREKVKGSRSLRPDFESENIRVMNLEADSRYNLGFLGRLLSLVRRERPEILHTHLPRADIAGALVSRPASRPALVCSVHGIYRERWFGSWAAPFMRWAYGDADAVIAISAAVEDWLRQDLGICGNHVRVIHYGIEPERFAPSTKKSQPAINQRNDPVVIGSMGRLEPGKGFDCLIRAMQIVRAQIPEATLLIAGHDPLGYGAALQKLIADLNLEQQVRLVGFQADTPAFFKQIDLFAFASHSEGFGQVVIEAMAAANPVIVSKIPPLTEIVIDGENGLLVERGNPNAFADAMIRLSTNPAKRWRMGGLGQERINKHFTVAKMASETMSLYEQLLKEKSALRSVA